MDDRVRAHGHAAHATLRWLHGRPVKSVSMADAPVHYGIPEPKTREQVEDAIRLLLAPAVGEMLHAGGTPESHITQERPEVRRALEWAGRLGPGHPVDHLEHVYASVIDTLTSPRIWHGVQALAGALLAHRAMTGDRAAAVLKAAMMGGAVRHVGTLPLPTRRITVMAR